MHATGWRTLGLVIGLVTAGPVSAQTYLLSETPKDGDCFRVTAETSLTGTLKVTRDGKVASVRLTAKNEHAFAEKVLAVDKGKCQKAARHYQTAVSRSTVDTDKVDRSLSDGRRLIVAQRTGDALFCYAPAGPLTRGELEVVSEHFETLHLPGLLPGKEVKVGETWKIDPAAAQSVCLFDGLISHELTGTLKEVSGQTAVVRVEGTAKGIETGALVNLTVAANMHFDLAARRIVAVAWSQRDTREQGPVSPAAEVETTTVVKREPLAAVPEELAPAALARVPAETDPPRAMQYLFHRDPAGRYQFLHSRDWHTVGQTDYHLIMRLLDRGDFVAQATLAVWKNAGAGKHISPEEFDKLVASGTGWKPEEVVDRGEVPTDGDRWAYRVVARGELDGAKVVQSFYVLADASGEQVILTFTMKPTTADRLGTRDVALVNAIEFPKK